MTRCTICGKEFEPDKYHKNTKTCSKKCRARKYYLENKDKILEPKKDYPIRKCLFCGSEYKPKRYDQKYCSNKCNISHKLNINRKYKLKERKCEWCGKLFIPDKNHPLAKTCSTKCNKALWFQQKKKKHKLIEKECLWCNKKFIPEKHHPLAKFCSTKCNKAYNYHHKYRKNKTGWNTKKYCIECGKQIVFDKTKPFNTEMTRKFCSKKCQTKYAHQRFKKNSPEKYKAKIKRRNDNLNFKLRNRFRSKQRLRKIKECTEYKFSWEEWEELKKKTKGICPKCKKYVGLKNIDMDHIYPVSKAYKDFKKTGKKRIYTIKDVQPLCKSCNIKKSDKF